MPSGGPFSCGLPQSRAKKPHFSYWQRENPALERLALMPKKAAKTAKKKKAKKAPKASKSKAVKVKKAAHKASKPSTKGRKGKAKGSPKPASASPHTAAKRIFAKPPFPIKAPKIQNAQRTESINRAAEESKRSRALNPKFLEQQKKKLLDLRDHILDQMQGVAQDNLRSRPEGNEASAFGMHQADAGSDAYEKDFALSLLSQEQDALYEIEQALKRIEVGTYGICEMSGKPIPLSRMEAIPFARHTVECQAQVEKELKGRNRWDTAPQFMDSTESFFEEEESEEDEEKTKLKD